MGLRLSFTSIHSAILFALLFPLAACESTSELDLGDMELLLTNLAILKHYPEFLLQFNNTGNFTSEDFESMLDDLMINLRKLDSTKDIELRCTMETNSTKKLCKTILSSQCLSSKEMVSIIQADKAKTTTEVISKLCPLLLFQSHEKSCSVPEKVTKKKAGPSTGAVWGFGILFVTLISCCSLVGVMFLPLANKRIYETVLMLFEGLAVGSLASSAVFHLIPQAFSLLGEDAQYGYLWKSLIIFVGIYMFFLSERFMKIFINQRKKKQLKKFSSGTICNVATVIGISTSLNGNQDGTLPKSPSDESFSNDNSWTNDKIKQLSKPPQEPEVALLPTNHQPCSITTVRNIYML